MQPSKAKKVAIIPARGGSKRIPKKNIRHFCGQPMLSYPIKLAKECNIFDEIVISSDDEEILQLAKNLGAKPLRRPDNLSDDTTPTLPVISHAIKEIGLLDSDLVCCIYPATPLLESHFLLEGLNAITKTNNKDYAFSVTEFASSPFRGFSIDNDVLTMLFPKFQSFRSQDLKSIYHDAGAFYWGWAQSFLEHREIFSPQSLPIILPRLSAQDIDTIDDWNLAEIKYQLKHAQCKK